MRRTTRLSMESLEPRLAMTGVTAALANGVLSVTGTSGDDQIAIDRRGDRIQVVQVSEWFSVKDIDQIEVDLGDGNDTLTMRSSWRSPKSIGEMTTITAGDGNDVFSGPDRKKLYIGGEDDLVSLTAKGAVTIDGVAPDWFNRNVSDSSLRSLARAAAIDQVFSRDDMMDLFADVTPVATVGQTAFDSLKAIVGNSKFFVGLDYVKTLSSYVVSGCVANGEYRGNPLGNLEADSTGAQLQLLVNKWFLGLDHPDPHNVGVHGTLTYKTAHGDLFDGLPTYVQMDQGEDGDCYFLSAMTSVTTKDPSKIVDMFIDNGDDTLTVRFFHRSKAYYVTIDWKLPVDAQDKFVFANDGERFDSAHNILWPAFAEKAFAQYAEFGFLDTGGPKNNSYGAIQEGYPNQAMHAILGQKTSSMMQIKTKTSKEMLKAFNSGRPVVLVTLDPPPDPHIVTDHVYAMVGYNATTQKFELFNPWGILHNSSNKPGYNYLTFEEIVNNFGYWAHGPVL